MTTQRLIAELFHTNWLEPGLIEIQKTANRRNELTSRYTFGGDEHILVEIDEEMSLEAFFKSLSLTNEIREAKIKGVTEICPANASYQVKFDPDIVHPEDLLFELKEMEKNADQGKTKLNTRIIEIPVYYQDPWTTETLMRFRDRHQDPNSTDIEFAAQINGYKSVDAFIKHIQVRLGS